MTHPWEKPPVQEPDYNEIPTFLKRESPKPKNEEPKQEFPWGVVPEDLSGGLPHQNRNE